MQGPEFHSFAFISDDLLLVAFVDGGQLSFRVLLVTLGNSMSSAEDAQYLCEMWFPILWGTVEEVSIISEPSLTSMVPNIPAAPFTAFTDVLFMVTLRYSTGMDFELAVVFLIPRSTILYHVSCVSISSQKHLEWESWGPKGSRCESKWVIWVGQITQTQHLSKDYESERVVVCLCGTRGEITYGEGDASTPKGWCRRRQRALLTSRSDGWWRESKTRAFL